MPEQYHCSTEQEKERYNQHHNFPSSQTYPGYESWMKDFIKWAKPHGTILDYGCGANPVLAGLLKAEGLDCTSYDPYFFCNEKYLLETYDCLLVSEVIEHFRRPREEWIKLLSLLKFGGSLYIRTTFWKEEREWKNWSYQRDFTHVTFYHPKTLTYLSEQFELELVRFENDKVEFRRNRT